MVAGRTIWQQASRSSGVSALPLMASRRRCSSVNGMRFRPVLSVYTSRSTRTSSRRYSILRASCSLMAYATIAIMNWNVTGSIGRRLPLVAAPFQACISIGKRATIRRHEFLDTTACDFG